MKEDSDTSVFLKYIPFGEVIGPVKLDARMVTIWTLIIEKTNNIWKSSNLFSDLFFILGVFRPKMQMKKSMGLILSC